MNVGERPAQLTVNILQKHIDNAIARDSNKCAIAEAIKEMYPHYDRISVDLATIRVSDRKRRLRSLYFTPPRLQKFILDFDQGHRKELKPLKTKIVAGQVVPITTHTKSEKAALRKAYHEKYRERHIARKRLLKTHGGTGRVPVVAGGKLPPIAQGKFRTFGLRTLSV